MAPTPISRRFLSNLLRPLRQLLASTPRPPREGLLQAIRQLRDYLLAAYEQAAPADARLVESVASREATAQSTERLHARAAMRCPTQSSAPRQGPTAPNLAVQTIRSGSSQQEPALSEVQA